MTNTTDEDDDYDSYEGYDDDFCDCEDYDADILTGRAQCFKCGRSWWMISEEITREIRWQAEMMECAEEPEITEDTAARSLWEPRETGEE